MIIKDTYNRSFQTLRVSLTNVCNFACTYCVHGDEKNGLNNANYTASYPLSHVQLGNTVIRLHRLLNFTSVRLTGGEPLLYPQLISLLELLSSEGIQKIKMTTNGYLLKQKAEALASLGVKEINVSLDAIDPATFALISRRDCVRQVLDGIEAALHSGISVKLNAVIMRGVNEQQILPLLEYAMADNIRLRYLELMRMGHLYSSGFERYFFPMEEILNEIQTKFRLQHSYRSPSATAKYFQLENDYKFGIIANESEPFCSDCNRLRLDNSGNIYGCLSENKREYIADIAADEVLLTEKLQRALAHKQPLKFKGSPMTMIAIGG